MNAPVTGKHVQTLDKQVKVNVKSEGGALGPLERLSLTGPGRKVRSDTYYYEYGDCYLEAPAGYGNIIRNRTAAESHETAETPIVAHDLKRGRVVCNSTPSSTSHTTTRTSTLTPVKSPVLKGKTVVEPWVCPPLNSYSKRGMRRASKNYAGRWRDCSKRQKLHRAFVHAEVSRPGFSVAWSLNLSGTKQKTLKKSSNPAYQLSKDISAALKKRGLDALAYAFALEVDQGKLHAHGVYMPSRSDEAYFYLIDEALTEAGGKLTKKERMLAGGEQCICSWLYEGHGWFEYVSKASRGLQEIFPAMDDKQFTFISNAMVNRCNPKEAEELPGQQMNQEDFESYKARAGRALKRLNVLRLRRPRRARRVQSWPLGYRSPSRRRIVLSGLYRRIGGLRPNNMKLSLALLF
nr:hypothetical protein [uncultured Cohaesibacter sp.]